MDQHANLAYSTVAAAPAPAVSGVSLTVAAGTGGRFPPVPFNATVWPAGLRALPGNAEIVRVTARAGDVLTIVRAQEGIAARSILVTDQIAATITKKTIDDIELAVSPSAINLHASKYNTPVDGVTDARAAILAAIADTPSGGTLRMGAYKYVISATIDLSSRPDICIRGAGGGVLGNNTAQDGTVILVSGSTVAFTINPVTQENRGPSFYDIHVYDGSATATGWYVKNINLCYWERCSVKYAAKGWFFDGGSDNAWHDLVACTGFQNTTSLHCSGNFGLRVHGGQFYVVTGNKAVIFENNAQNNKLIGTFFDGISTSTGNGIGVFADTGAHENELLACKMEALATCVQLRNTGGGSPTRSLRIAGGSYSAFAGTETMVDIGAGVDMTVVDHATFPASNTYASMVVDNGSNTDWELAGDNATRADAFAAAYTPSSFHLGRRKTMTLTGNITSVAATPDVPEGKEVTLVFTQDGTGGRTLPAAGSWTGYKVSPSNTGNTAGKVTVFHFAKVGGTLVQIGTNVWM